MSWRTDKLGSVITLKRGYDLPEAKRVPGEVPIISSSGVTGAHNEKKADGPGVVTGRYGTLGEVFYIEGPYWPLNTSLYVQDFKGNHPRFISYFLRNVLRTVKSDKAAVPGVNRNDLHKRPVSVPDRPLQQNIADVLANYDDLIENNRRRIYLLEQAVWMLFKEWFVRLRFPGHEHAKSLRGVPEGWKKKRLGEIVTLQYGKALKEDDRIPGPFAVYGSSGIVGTHEKALVGGPAIVVGRKGNVGSVYWSDGDFFPIDTVYYIDSAESSLYLYYSLKNLNFISTDVAVPGLNRDFAHSREILLASDTPRFEFEEAACAIHRQISVLRRQSEAAARARDLLLPRLMNGTIIV